MFERSEQQAAGSAGAAGGAARPTTSTRGIVDPAAARTGFVLERYAPAPDLAHLVERHWVVRWELPADVSFSQLVIPHPSVNLVAEPDVFAAHGIPEGIFERTLAGSGAVVGTKLRPGAFRVLLDRPDAVRRGAVLPAETVLGPAADDVGKAAVRAACAGDDALAIALVTRLLRERVEGLEAGRAMRDLAQVTTVFEAVVGGDLGPRAGVTDLAQLAGTTTRSLQRVFSRAVGVSPKWVLQRHRVHLAADLIAADPDVELAVLATEAGYYDQAHFGSDFALATGMTPGAYARRCAASRQRLLAVLGQGR